MLVMNEPRAPIALTGATGFLGGHIAAAILDAGLPLRAVVRDPARARHLEARGAEVVMADLNDGPALARALAGAAALVSNASLGSWAGEYDVYQRVNVDGIENLFDAARRVGLERVVMISTVAVYRTQLRRVMTEASPGYDADTRRLNWSDVTTDWRYARSKTRAEAVAARHARALTILRPGPIYGSGDPKLTARYLRSAARRVVLAPTVGVPQVHAADVALATVAALQRPDSIGRAYNLAGPPTSPLQVLRILRRLHAEGLGQTTRARGWVVPIPLPISVRFDCSAARRDLDFVPRSLEDGLREVLRAATMPPGESS